MNPVLTAAVFVYLCFSTLISCVIVDEYKINVDPPELWGRLFLFFVYLFFWPIGFLALILWRSIRFVYRSVIDKKYHNYIGY